MLAVVMQIDGYDPVAGAAVTLRAASVDDAAVCHLNGETWWPALAKLPTLRHDLFDGSFGGQITVPGAALTLRTEPWPLFGRYALADARVRLWTGDAGTTWSSYVLRFDGRVTAQPALEDGAAQIEIAVDGAWLDAALLKTYAGTTGAEGPAALKGQAKPLAIGAPRYVEGVLVDAVNSVFQLSATAINGVEAALERLARFGAPLSDQPSYAALVAAAIPPGRWATAKASGMVRFGAPPTGQVSFLLQGDAGGVNGWVRTPGKVIRRLADIAGANGKTDDASLVALDTARPYPVSIYRDGQTTARELVQDLAASLNCVAGVSWLGKLFVAPVAIGAPTLSLAADGSALPPVTAVKQLEIAAPYRSMALSAERAEVVHALSDIAFTATLVDMGAYAATTTYREGNIVQQAGSTWLYINPAPTAGNAPPALPTTSNPFWKVLARAGADGADGADGAPGAPGATGAPGAQGLQGVPGSAGADGQSSYVHFAYANAPDGSVDFTTGDAGGRAFIGVYTDTNSGADSTNPAAYGWTRLRGADGAQGLPGPGGYAHIAYANAADGSVDFHVSDATNRRYIGTYTDQVAADSTNPTAYTWSLIKGADGTNGTNGTDGQDGAAGQDGADGQDAVVMDVSRSSATVQADSNGTTKSGQLPLYAKVTVMQGGTNVTGASSFTLAPSSAAIAATITGGDITITQVGGSGYLDVGASYAGAVLPSKRIQLIQQRDAAPPASQTSGSGAFSGMPTTASYTGPAAQPISLRANSGGQITFTGGAEYYAEVPTGGIRTYTLAMAAAYRPSGAGGYSYSAEATGSQAQSTVGNDPAPGAVSLTATIGGLTPGAFYEVGPALRKVSGTAQTPSGDGSFTVSQ